MRRFIIYARATAGVVIFFSLLIIIGWAINQHALTTLCPEFGDQPGLPFMGSVQSTAAITLILYSVSLLLIMSGNSKLRIAGETLAALGAIGVAAAVVCSFFFPDVDGLRFLQMTEDAVGVTYPIPIAREIGIDLFVVGVALLLLRFRTDKNISPAQIAALAASPIPLLIVLGAATKIDKLCALGGCFRMSTGFAILALALCSAIFLSDPEEGAASLYAGTSTASLVLRRATLFLCSVPALLIVRTIMVYHLPLQISPEVGWVIFVFAILVLAISFILPGIKTFDRLEVELSNELTVTKEELERTRQSRTSIETEIRNTFGHTTMRYKRICLTCTSEFDDSHETCPHDKTPLSRVVDDSLIGVMFDDKYQITEMLGTGGMSTVYKATHVFLKKDMAIKVLKGNAASTPDGLKRFRREARATIAVKHEGIVGVSDFGLAPDGRAYLVMDYLQGESVSSVLDRMGPLKVPYVVALGTQICEALAVAHEKGVVHRDLKPSNIMLVKNEDGSAQAKIVDFGLAKIIEEDAHLSMKITQTGECFGSPLYMSPEQCMGKKVDQRSDIYALGCIFYELLTGYPPIMGQSAADTVRRQVTERPSPIPDEFGIPNEIKIMIYKCLNKDPAWRPQHVRELLVILQGVKATAR